MASATAPTSLYFIVVSVGPYNLSVRVRFTVSDYKSLGNEW